MSLTKAVTHKVNELRRATVAEVAAHFPNKTPEQVRHALANAAFRMQVKVEKGRGLGRGKGMLPATYVSCKAAPTTPEAK